jgi:aminopeptidase N
MWFGNLVTPVWWDGLWLNEAFADMISFMCMDEAKGLEDCYLAWNIFMDETLWGLKEDQMDSTHPVNATCKSVADAADIFDGLSYGKGASFLHQLVFFFGVEVLKEGCNTWFKEFKYKNSN